MEKFIPYEKLSKKKKREQDSRRRSFWAISSVTRRPENPKAYKRKKIQDRNDDSDPVFLYGRAKATAFKRTQVFPVCY